MQLGLRNQSGFSAISFVVIVAGIAGAISSINLVRSQGVFKASDVKNASQEAGDLNFNALNVYQALASGNQPAIYPDPYLPINGARMVVSDKATPNNLWRGDKEIITIYSRSYHGNPEGTKSSTSIRSTKLAATNGARPYLLTETHVHASSTVDTALAKSKKSIDSKAVVNLPPPPAPTCDIKFIGTPATSAFICMKKEAKKEFAMDPATGLPQVDPKTGDPIIIEKPAVYDTCGGAAEDWSFDTDAGQTVTILFYGNGVIVDASVQRQPGRLQPLNFAAGPLPKNSAEVPYLGANRIHSKDAKLHEVTFTAANSQWIQMDVEGPDGKRSNCVAGLHVNRGPDLNTESDSWGPESLVQLEDGRFLRIADLKVGDRVRNPRFGEAEEVLYIHKTAPTSSMVEIQLGQETLHVTSHHPFISKRGLVLAKDLRVGDLLPGAEALWLSVSGVKRYRPADGFYVYDVFLNSRRPPMERYLNVQGLAVHSFEWQSQLAMLPEASFTLLDDGEIFNGHARAFDGAW